MSATENFLRCFRDGTGRDLVVLVRLSLRDPVSLAATDYYLASRAISTPAGTEEPARLWRPNLGEVGSIRETATLCETDVVLASTSLTILPRALPGQGANETAFHLLYQKVWSNAPVSIWLWDARLTSFDDAFPVLSAGEVIATSVTKAGIVLTIRQRTDWNRGLPRDSVTLERYPQATTDTLGSPLPINYGALRDVPMVEPWEAYPQVKFRMTPEVPSRNYGISQVFGGRRVAKALLVDTGRGGGGTNPKARVVVAGHRCKNINDFAQGVGFFLDAGNVLASVMPASGDVVNTDTEAAILLADNATEGIACAFPVDVSIVANTAENPRAVLDPYNSTNFAKFDWTAGYRTLRLRFANLPDVGDLWPADGSSRGVCVFYGYRAPDATNLKCRHRSISNPASYYDLSVAASATLKAEYAFVNSTWITSPWDFSDWEVEFGWPTSSPAITGTGTAELYFLGLMAYFVPRQSTVESEKEFVHTETRPLRRRGIGHNIWLPYEVRETIPAVMEIVGKFFANLEGYPDDASGTYTGTPDALIQRPTDVLRHLLEVYGGEIAARFPASGFGSIVEAREFLKTWKGLDFALAFQIADSTDVMTVLSWIAQASVSQVYLDRFSNEWRIVPFDPLAPVDYPLTFKPTMVVEQEGPTCEVTPPARVLSGVKIAYGRNAKTGGTMHQTRLSYDGSDAGHLYRDLRDESLVVETGVNDRFDFRVATGAERSVTIPAGAYTPQTLRSALQPLLEAAYSDIWTIVHGFEIVAGYNDVFEWRRQSGVLRQATIPPGYYTGEELAQAMEDAIIVYSGPIEPYGVDVSFSRTTRLFSFAPRYFTLNLPLAGASTAAASRFFTTLGFTTYPNDLTIAAGATGTTTYPREEDRFVLAMHLNTWTILWESGSHGLKAVAGRTNCAEVLGFYPLRDTIANTYYAHMGNTPKGSREIALLASAQINGAKKDTTEELRAVWDTDTAREVRNRIVALLGVARLTITFSTNFAPDLQRGRVVGFDSDMDAVLPYPLPGSDGSWSGKRFVVIEVEQVLGPAAFYTKVRAVSLD